MKDRYGIYTDNIIKYCNDNGIDFNSLANMKVVWGIDVLEIRNKEDKAFLRVSGYDVDNIAIEKLL